VSRDVVARMRAMADDVYSSTEAALYREGADEVERLTEDAACCSGDAARLVRRLGNHTYDRAAVTCKRCLAAIAREVKP
jgi:hypothetical protein